MTSGAPLRPGESEAMQAALEEAEQAALAGEVPVGAVVLRDGRILSRAQNRMTRDADATAHAETLVLRAAMQALGTARLEDARSPCRSNRVRCARERLSWHVSIVWCLAPGRQGRDGLRWRPATALAQSPARVVGGVFEAESSACCGASCKRRDLPRTRCCGRLNAQPRPASYHVWILFRCRCH
jgi:tRNA(adenine34) deaminase